MADSTRDPQFGQASCSPSMPEVVTASKRSTDLSRLASTARRRPVSDEYGRPIETSVECGVVVRRRRRLRPCCQRCSKSHHSSPGLPRLLAVRPRATSCRPREPRWPRVVSATIRVAQVPQAIPVEPVSGAPHERWRADNLSAAGRVPARDSIPMTRRGAPGPCRGRARPRSHPRLCCAASRRTPRPSDERPLPVHGLSSGRLPQVGRSPSLPRPRALRGRATFPRACSAPRRLPRSHPRLEMIAPLSANRQLALQPTSTRLADIEPGQVVVLAAKPRGSGCSYSAWIA
jgi:hypothetical protein